MAFHSIFTISRRALASDVALTHLVALVESSYLTIVDGKFVKKKRYLLFVDCSLTNHLFVM